MCDLELDFESESSGKLMGGYYSNDLIKITKKRQQ